MFFDIILLNYQHKGNLGKAWIAATRGVRYISTEDVLSINICRLCDDLYKFIVSSSGDPKKRFSLRMSAILLHGAIRLHNRQVVILQVDAAKVLQRCTIPAGSRISLREVEQSDDEHSPHLKRKLKKRPIKRKQPISDSLTPLEEVGPGMQRFDEDPFVLPQSGDVFRHPGHPEVVTIRETEIASKTVMPEEGFGADVSVQDIMDILERVGSPRQPSREAFERSRRKSSSESTTITQPTEIVVQADIHAGRGTYIDETSSHEIRAELTTKEPSTRHPTIVQQQLSAVTPMEIEVSATAVRPAMPMEEIETVPPAAEVPPPPSIQEKRAAPSVDLPEEPVEAEVVAVESRVEAAKQKNGAVPRPGVVPRKRRMTEEDIQMFNRLITRTKTTSLIITRRLRGRGQFTGPEVQYRSLPLDEPNATRLYQLRWDGIIETEEGAEQVRAMQEAPSEDQLRVSAQLPGRESAQSMLDKRSSEDNLLTPREGSLEDQRRSLKRGRLTPIRLPSIRIEEPTQVKQIPTTDDRIVPMPAEHVLVEEVVEQIQMELPLEQISVEQVRTEPVPMEQEPIEEQQAQMQQMDHVVQVVPTEQAQEVVEGGEMLMVRENRKTRQQNIVDIVMRWDYSTKLLTIEDICEKPFNKLKMARAFGDLLTLTANKFVKLVTQEGSLELSHIVKGSRLE